LDWDPGDDGVWRRDAEHNPDPLSAAQASLVALVEDLPGAPSQRVLGGYLFARAAEAAAPSTKGIAPTELPRRFADEVVPACDALLGPFEAGPLDGAALPAALDAYRGVLGRYLGEVSPSLRRARSLLDQFLRTNLGERLEAHGDLLAGT